MRRLAPLLAVLAILTAGVLAGAATPASAASGSTVRFGIGDQHPTMFTDDRWQSMDLRITRYFIPWDAADDPEALARARAFVLAARAEGVQTLLHLTGRFQGAYGEELPSRRAYRRQVDRLVAQFRPLGVRDWGVWNEANHSSQPTNHRPDRAAQYFLEMRAACRGCTIVAVDLLTQGGPRSDGISSYRGYLRRFYAALGSKRGLAKIVGIHNYGELVLTKGAATSRDLTTYARRFNRKTRFWITESGGLAANRSRGCSESRQTVGTSRMFSHAAALARNGVDRLYMYNWTASDCDYLFDTGLIRSDGTARPALAAVQRGARSFGR